MHKFYLFILFYFVFLVDIVAQYNSVLSSGDWYQVSTSQDGIYKLDFNDFNELGIDLANLSVENIKIYGNGAGMLPHLNSEFRYDDLQENAIDIFDANSNGIFEEQDYILFFGESPDIWRYNSSTNLFDHETHLFSDEVYYYINISEQGIGKRVLEKELLLNYDQEINSFRDYSFHEEELYNLIKSGRKWFGEQFNFDNQQEFIFSFPNIDSNSPVFIETSVAARSLTNSIFNLKLNNIFLSSINIPAVLSSPSSEYAKSASLTNNITLNTSEINLSIEYLSSDAGANSWLDYIEINADRFLKMHNNAMRFRQVDNISQQVGRFEIQDASNSRVWDITDVTNVKELSVSVNGNTIFFNDSIDYIYEYIVFNPASYLNPSLKGKIQNQNLHNISSEVEYVIISHPKFINAANRLASFYESKQSMNVIVVTPTTIYHEFSSGMQDVTAIRDFLKMLYQRDNSQLKYVLLFGDGSYDPKDRVSDNTNYILTYQSLNSTNPTLSYVTDDYFALLDEEEGLFLNDLVDIGIGRLPVLSLEEANHLVDKIEKYYAPSSFGSWRNDIAFIADDGDANDGNTHMSQADSLSNIVLNNYQNLNVKKIYLDNYLQESTPGGPRSEATQNAINNKINKGALLVNYTGHGGQLGWAQERILEIDQILNFNNEYLPLFMTATCKFSYFDNPEKRSAGEHLLLNKDGGAIGLFTTTRLVYSSPNYNLNKKFINTIFERIEGKSIRLGDLFKQTKRLSGTGANNRNFVLLGDPALRLAYPEYFVETVSVSDTMKALTEVTITGTINDENGKLETFNGTIFPTVYDKEIIRTTLGQQSCTPMPYRDQNNILYKGSASVIGGDFTFSFIVPKDIAYNYGSGKISYYAFSDDINPVDATGSSNNFLIGGVGENITYDYDGPEINLFMNDRSFKDGGITDRNPYLLVDVFDLSGINTVGNGIGHDITAILDEFSSTPYILNDYYEAAKDDYTNGTIRFQFTNLEEGYHTITVKIWDVFNNSSESMLDFIVTDGGIFTVDNYRCYPNPFVNSTDFYFSHNQPNNELDITLDIYSITGHLVRSIKNNTNNMSYNIGPISWDGKGENGNKLSHGVYIANINIRSKNDFLSKSIRIILLPE